MIALRRRGLRSRGPRWLRVLLPLSLLLMLFLAGCSAASGAQWQAFSSTQSLSVISLATDPHQGNLIYAGTTNGEVLRTLANSTGEPGAGTGIPQNVAVGAILPDPHSAGRVYAGTTHGLYVSTNSGETWQARGTGFPTDDSMVALTFGVDGRTLYAGTVNSGLYVSHDAGNTWQQVKAALPTNRGINALWTDTPNKVLYAAFTGGGLYLSKDGGASWQQVAANGLPGKGEILTLTELQSGGINPSGPTLYAGTGAGVYASGDGGQTWNAVNGRAPLGKVLALSTYWRNPGSLYAGTEATVFVSSDGGQHWHPLAGGLSHPAVAVTEATDNKVGTIVYVASGGLARYPGVGPGDTGSVAVEVGILVLLVAAVAFVFLRSRRTSALLIRTQEAPRQHDASASREGAPPQPTGAASRSGMSPNAGARPLQTRARTGNAPPPVNRERQARQNGHHLGANVKDELQPYRAEDDE